MDSSLLGVIIGTGATLIGTIIGNIISPLISLYKEKKQWERQRISTKEDKQEEMIKQEREYLRELYYKCLLSLSVYISKANENFNANKENKVDLSEYEKEAHQWLSLLSLRCQDDELDSLVDRFHNGRFTGTLRKYILELAKKEQSFFHSNLEASDDVKPQISNDTKKIKIDIDNAFRKQHIIKMGVELPTSYEFECKLTKLTSTQREKLVEMCFKNGAATIPNNLYLNIPVCVQTSTQVTNNGQKKIMNIQDRQWKAKLNPLDLTSNQILDHWVKDYDEYYKIAQEKLNTSS